MNLNLTKLPDCPFCGSKLLQRTAYQPPKVNCESISCPIYKVAISPELWCKRVEKRIQVQPLPAHWMAVAGIPEDEPIWVLRAKDKLTPRTIHYWGLELVREITCDSGAFLVGKYLELVPEPYRSKAVASNKDVHNIIDWQTKNRDKVKLPD